MKLDPQFCSTPAVINSLTEYVISELSHYFLKDQSSPLNNTYNISAVDIEVCIEHYTDTYCAIISFLTTFYLDNILLMSATEVYKVDVKISRDELNTVMSQAMVPTNSDISVLFHYIGEKILSGLLNSSNFTFITKTFKLTTTPTSQRTN